jgi:hypothetical protein
MAHRRRRPAVHRVPSLRRRRHHPRRARHRSLPLLPRRGGTGGERSPGLVRPWRPPCARFFDACSRAGLWRRTGRRQSDFMGGRVDLGLSTVEVGTAPTRAGVSAIGREREHTDDSSFRLERAVMFGFFIVRRLHEAHKVTDRTMNAGVRFMRYVPRGAPPDLLNWNRIDEHYDCTAVNASNSRSRRSAIRRSTASSLRRASRKEPRGWESFSRPTGSGSVRCCSSLLKRSGGPSWRLPRTTCSVRSIVGEKTTLGVRDHRGVGRHAAGAEA